MTPEERKDVAEAIKEVMEKKRKDREAEAKRKEEEEKKKAEKPKRKQKEKGPEITYEQVASSTLPLNAPSILPYMPFNDPKAMQLPIVAYTREKSIIHAMSTAVKKAPFPVMTIVIILIVGAVAMAIIGDRVIIPAMKQSQEYDYKLRTNNLTASDKPPSLFDFKAPSLGGIIPGVK